MNLRLCFYALVLTWTLASRGANAPSGLLCDLLSQPEKTVISNNRPEFGWIYTPSFRDDYQTGYRLVVSSDQELAEAGTGNVWDSGWITNGNSINVNYLGKPLATGVGYFWRVQTADSMGQIGPFSKVQHFVTGPMDVAYAGCYPPHFQIISPVLLTNTAPGRWFVDFGQDSFGFAKVQAPDDAKPIRIQARFGEMAEGEAVDATLPSGSMVRYSYATITLPDGSTTCDIRPPARPLPEGAVNPQGFGEVTPFRYLELFNIPGKLTLSDVKQMRLVTSFDTNAASFDCSNPALNQIWNLCRNSMQVLTFDGIYVDGDRERKPYEADAYIHQMSSYGVDREFMLARRSLEYLLRHPTWPTEWKFHAIMMAWADYMQTGDASLLGRYYDILQSDSFVWAADGGGLMRGFPDFPQTTNSDVVDWPPSDRDGFVIKKGRYRNWTNSVNNAFYYHCLRLMANIAAVLGRTNDAASYSADATKAYSAFNSAFWNESLHCYEDGIAAGHASTLPNVLPLAFGLVPANRQASVVSFIHSRIAARGGMPCSVYGAQYLLEALFQAGDVDTAMSLLTSNGPRGWLNMINQGSTITTEAWNFDDKPNMDWNHAWGAAPGNLIPRFILGLRPLTAGFGQILIQPHLGHALTFAHGTIPTIRGEVAISVTNNPEGLQMLINVPGNVIATVALPTLGATNPVALVDGYVADGKVLNQWLVVANIGSGQHSVWLSQNASPSAATLYANWAASYFGRSPDGPSVIGQAWIRSSLQRVQPVGPGQTPGGDARRATNHSPAIKFPDATLDDSRAVFFQGMASYP